jgi:predicted DNA-binding WGR domain protein
MKYYLENRSSTGETEHSKFYQIEEIGNDVVFTWGPTGAPGQKKVALTSTDSEARKSCADAQLRAKQKRGYQIIENNGTKIESRPGDIGRFWGIEIETHSDVAINTVADGMKARGLVVNVESTRYFKSNGCQWDVKRDGSCGYEFASPKLRGEAGIFDAKLAVEKIREVCLSAVNHKCGIHVTIDISDFNSKEVKRLAIAYLKSQEHFYKECADWRQDNHYCQRNCQGQVQQAIGALIRARDTNEILMILSASNRYQGLNWARYTERKVIEFRMMESSVAIRKVGAWIRLCVGFVDGVKRSTLNFATNVLFKDETFKEWCKWVEPEN